MLLAHFQPQDCLLGHSGETRDQEDHSFIPTHPIGSGKDPGLASEVLRWLCQCQLHMSRPEMDLLGTAENPSFLRKPLFTLQSTVVDHLTQD